jgi:hypothetical protein
MPTIHVDSRGFMKNGQEGFASYFKNIILMNHQYNLGVERDQDFFF